MRTTLNLDDELARAAKERALADGTTLTSLVERALRSILRDSPAGPAQRVELPVIGGALQPGVDLDDHDAVKDLLTADEDRSQSSEASRVRP
ncbi:MAG: type II toxin-antitoxin system VapB family antitoxin [Dermatophilaceae bacterium]